MGSYAGGGGRGGGSGFFANEIWESYIRKGLFSRGGLIIGIVWYYSERECVF